MRSGYRSPKLWLGLVLLGASLLAPGASSSVGRTSLLDPSADFDGDGVDNALDNCLIAANADQRDTDRDGIGNACDADFDQSGLVDLRDLFALLRAFDNAAPDEDLNGDGVVDAGDLRIFLRLLLLRRPGPRLDGDRDGVADLEDPCPMTAQGLASRLPGCSVLQLLQQPERLLRSLTSQTQQLAVQLGAAPEMRGVVAQLEFVVDEVDAAAGVVKRGDACDAGASFTRADAAFAAALEDVERQLAAARAALPDTRGQAPSALAAEQVIDTAGDVSDADLLVAGLQFWRGQIDAERALNRRSSEIFADICAQAHAGTARGVVQQTLDAERRIVFRDGRSFALADPVALSGEIVAGREVEVAGSLFADGNGYASRAGPVGLPPDVPQATAVDCLHLRFAPVQRFPPASFGPFVLHDPLGYRPDGSYVVEVGMAVAAQSTCPPPNFTAPSVPRYSLELEISYRQKKTGTQRSHAPLAPELTASDAPVPFPLDVDPDAPATLHVTSEVRSCPQAIGAQCGVASTIDAQDYPLEVRPKGSLAFATYENTLFDVNDQKSGDFRLAHVLNFLAIPGWDSGTTPSFVAEGYGPFFDGIALTPIVDTDPFAIRSDDFYPLFRAVTLAQSFGEVVAMTQTGVDHAAGLRWPRVQGKRNGRDFWYSATLPLIARDVVDFCTVGDAYYRLPFAHGDFSWTQGQGNHPELKPNTPGVTHSGGYAYDMGAPLGTPFRAARAGRVVQLDDSNFLQCGVNDSCPPNLMHVLHQDGSFGEYDHMPQNSILPQVGDVVRRGEQLAVVGVVGRTSGPHLHFATRTAPKPAGYTFLAVFDVLNPLVINPELPLPCYIPQEGDPLRSNNLPYP